MTKNCT